MKEGEVKQLMKKPIKLRWLIFALIFFIAFVLYSNGRDTHITENVGEREVGIF